MGDKEKAIRLFKFLKEYNNIKNPAITDIVNQQWIKWMNAIPVHEAIINNIYNTENDIDVLFSISKPKLSECPNPPEHIREWLEPGWNVLNKEVTVKNSIEKLSEINDEDGTQELVTITFTDDVRRINLLKEWEKQRSIWVTSESKARKADEIYNEFYALYAILKKEADEAELVLGDGILCCIGKNRISHPILLQPVKLEFDTNIPQFKVVIADKNPELYKSIFSYITDVNYELLIDVYNEFNENQFAPYEIIESNSFMNRLSHALSLNGKFIEYIDEFINIETYPQIYRKPVLFVRKRNLGFGVAIDSIIEDVNDGEIIPSFLKDIVGIENKKNDTNSGINDSRESFLNSNGLDKDVLLTKPANTEQLSVAKHLETNGAVLVQGPPGTGKTHTIANMIGHLLSQGKSILVTSYSEKALSVLKEKVVDNLQALCLSLLSTTESRSEMEKTLDIINENRARLEPDTLEKKIEVLEQEREKNIQKLNELKLKLKNTRLNEYRPIVVAGR